MSFLSVPMTFPILCITNNWIFTIFVSGCPNFTLTAHLKIVHKVAGIRIPLLWLYKAPLYVFNTFCLCINFPGRHLGCFCFGFYESYYYQCYKHLFFSSFIDIIKVELMYQDSSPFHSFSHCQAVFHMDCSV